MQNDFLEFDDDQAVDFIKNYIPIELKSKLNDDDIVYFLDLIADFYQSRGYMEMEDDDDTVVEIDEDEMVDYIVKNARRDDVGSFTEDEIRFIVQGEFEYCSRIGIFE